MRASISCCTAASLRGRPSAELQLYLTVVAAPICLDACGDRLAERLVETVVHVEVRGLLAAAIVVPWVEDRDETDSLGVCGTSK